MNSTVTALLVLQERDVRVASLTTELEDIPEQIEAAETLLARHTAKFEEIRNRTRQIEADRKKLDLEVQTKQTAIARYKAQQQQTRKNEEYSALTHEIEHAEKEISALEDQELELMEAYEKGLATVAEGQKELTASQEKTKQKKSELEKRATVVTAELASAKAQQTEAEAAVPEDDLARYRRILKSKKDVAIVPIHGGACGGCHMKLTSQTVISARGGEGLTVCDNCGRIVFFGE